MRQQAEVAVSFEKTLFLPRKLGGPAGTGDNSSVVRFSRRQHGMDEAGSSTYRATGSILAGKSVDGLPVFSA
jgi:hypothetical protein